MTYFVIRDTNHPQEDLERNWSAPAGGWDNEFGGMSFSSEEEAAEADMGVNGGERREYRFHPAYDGYVLFHYDGLGAFALDAETLEEAIEEAMNYEEGLAVCSEAGDGHFFAEDVVSFHKVREGRYIFEIK